jgi:uncharacterized protein
MSDSSSQQHEPSMEEILASIRRIISEDTDEDTPDTKSERPAEVADEPAVAEEEDDDVLELTEVLPDEPEPVEEEPVMAVEEEEDERDEPTVLEEEEDEPTILVEDESDAIISPAPAAQAADAIAGLMARVQSSTRLGDADLTIEQLTKDLLRPLLKEWLDANLPDMVERIVREEIERVVARSNRSR